MCALSNPCDIVAISFLQINCQSLSLGKEICPRLGQLSLISELPLVSSWMVLGGKAVGEPLCRKVTRAAWEGQAASFPWLTVCAGPTLGSKTLSTLRGPGMGQQELTKQRHKQGCSRKRPESADTVQGRGWTPRGAWRRSHVERGPGTGGGMGAEKGRCPCGDRLSTFSI